MKSRILLIVLCAVTLLTGNACKTPPTDILAIACDSQQSYQAERCAKAFVDVYGVYQARALEALQNPNLDESAKRGIAEAEEKATAAILEVNRANRTYVQTKEILSRKPDPTASDREQAIQQEAMLNDLVKLAAPKVNKLLSLIGGAK
jgi:hypothetical protein